VNSVELELEPQAGPVLVPDPQLLDNHVRVAGVAGCGRGATEDTEASGRASHTTA